MAEVLVSRPGGLGLGLETRWLRSWSRDFRKSLDLEIPRPRSRPVSFLVNITRAKDRASPRFKYLKLSRHREANRGVGRSKCENSQPLSPRRMPISSGSD